MRRFLSNLSLARVQKSETQAGVPVDASGARSSTSPRGVDWLTIAQRQPPHAQLGCLGWLCWFLHQCRGLFRLLLDQLEQ